LSQWLNSVPAVGGKGLAGAPPSQILLTHEIMIPHFTRSATLASPIAAALFLIPGLALSQTIPDIAPEIISAWKSNDSDTLLIFRYDGVYFQVEDDPSAPGMERGTFTWNNATSAFSATTLRDTNGESGLSHPAGATSLSVSGNTLTYTVVGEGSFTYSRVVSTTSAIVGSWLIPGEQTIITFLANGFYFHAEESNDVPDGYDGMERGTYTWDSFSGVLSAVPITDTNGWSGLSDPEPSFHVTILENVMTLTEGLDIYTLQRINTNATPFSKLLGDFHVEKFANYIQSADADPSPLDNPGGGDYPFWGEAYVQTYVGSTAPTLKIGTRTPLPFVLDSENSEFGIEQDNYANKAALDAATAFPDGTTYEFKSGSSTATLTFPASVEFPAVPQLLLGTGSWIGGSYQVTADGSLSWTGQSPFDPSKHATLLSIEDVTENPSVDLLKEFVIQGDVTSYDLAGKLIPGHDYWVSIEHLKIGSSTTSGTGIFAGRQGHAFHNTNTSFLLKATAEPASMPVITQQPVSQAPAEATEVLLTVGTNGEDHTLTYQWFKGNAAIPGQTGNSLTIRNYSTTADGGTYTVVVTNAAGSVTSSFATLGEADVEFVVIGKVIFYEQTGPTTVILDPSPVTPDYGGPLDFYAGVEGQNMSLIAAPTVTPPAGTPGPIGSPFYDTLYFNAEDLAWRYGPNGNDWGTLTQLINDTAFPNGTYTFLVDGVSVPLSLTGDAYPNTPQLTLSGGSWINGKYAMDTANALTVTTNTFTGYSANIDGRIGLEVGNASVEFFKNSSPSTNSATYTAPGNTLSPNEIIDVDAEFNAIVNKSNAIPGAYCAAIYHKTVGVEVHFLPEITSQSSSQAVSPSGTITLQVTATGSPTTEGGSLTYTWRKNGAILAGETSQTLDISAVSSVFAGTYTCTVSNQVGAATTTPIYLEYADAFQTYAASFGLNSVTTGAPDADFDKDGIPNLLEYLLGGNPTLPSSGLLPAVTKAPGSNNLVFTYKRKIAAVGVSQVIEHSANLSNTWSTADHGQNGVAIATAAVPGDATTEQVTVTIPSTSASRFVRLKASR
jgi:hypothetical protein